MAEKLIPKLFRITAFEDSLVKETADTFGCSQAVAVRLLIRRGYDWRPPDAPPLRAAPLGWTDPPDADGRLPDVHPPSLPRPPEVPEGQTMIGDDDE